MQSVFETNSKSIFMDGRTWRLRKGFPSYWNDERRRFQGDTNSTRTIIDRALGIRYFQLTPSKIYDYMASTDDAVNENDDMDVQF